ncbi:MAG: hypothetical protein PWQ67_1544 [Clostridia bacterium]|jgi:hypothetical protein|nr:hypothetical protein [Clostridia bacterium]MDN5323090.1 hypothetical protein [Clostridia bacterium]
MSILDSLFGSIKTSAIAAKDVSIDPNFPEIGEEIRVGYNGLLAQNGAEQVYLHVGYDNNWHDLEDIPMQKDVDGWYCEFIPQYSEVNFCFHDSANNWDNNNGSNWSIKLS